MSNATNQRHFSTSVSRDVFCFDSSSRSVANLSLGISRDGWYHRGNSLTALYRITHLTREVCGNGEEEFSKTDELINYPFSKEALTWSETIKFVMDTVHVYSILDEYELFTVELAYPEWWGTIRIMRELKKRMQMRGISHMFREWNT